MGGGARWKERKREGEMRQDTLQRGKHCITDYFLYYVIICINSVCMCSSSSLVYCISTYLVKRQSAGEGEVLHKN